MKKLFFTVLFLYTCTAFSFCDVIPKSIEEARELLFDEIIDSLCFNAAEALLLNPIDPIREGWHRLESVGFDLAPEEIPTTQEIIASGGDFSRLFRRYPLISQFEPFIRVSRRSLQQAPVRSTLTVFARRTDGDDEQYFSISSATRIQDNLLVSVQVRERQDEQYLENRSILYSFGGDNISGFFNAGNLTSPSNELLFGRYATFSQAQGADNLYYASRGGYNGIITQIGTQHLGATGYFHIRENEHLAGGGVFVQPQYFRLELKAIYAEKGENEEVLLQVRGNFTNLGISVSNAISLSSAKNATLVQYQKSARNLRIISQTYLLQEGYNSPFSSLIPRNDTLQNQKFGTNLSLSGRAKTQRYSLSTRYLLNGDFGTASIVGAYHLPEITGLGVRSNFSLRTDTTQLRQTHTVFNRKRIGQNFRTNASVANSFNKDGWRHSIFNLGLDSFLPNAQIVNLGYSHRIRLEQSPQETIFLSYSARSPSRSTKSLAMDIPLQETSKGMRIYGEMRFAFPVFDTRRL
ncbi:MAG: hypothetical protein FWE23_00300 [Chitinivibrionia bacterium]|nr:hypothetical protein [Chitinivibrionia bacterium]